MNKEETKKALAEINYRISVVKSSISSLEEQKQRIKVDVSKIISDKNDRLKRLQKEITNTKVSKAKTIKRASRDREKKSFENNLENKRKQIQNIDTQIINKRKEISDLGVIKQKIRLAETSI